MLANGSGTSAGGASAFDGDMMEMPDVSALLQSESEAEDEVPEKSGEQEQSEEEQPTNRQPDADEVAAKDFERWHKVMLRQVRNMKTDSGKLDASCKSMIKTMEQQLTEMTSEASLADFAKGEIGVVRRQV